MALRLSIFRCGNGHQTEALHDSDDSFIDCGECGNDAKRLPFGGGVPGVRSCERISRDEQKQYLAQFGQWDKGKQAWKFVPKNRDELNVALKQEGMTTISAKEFDSMLTKDRKPDAKEPTPEERGAMVDTIKNERQRFRSAFDSGNIPKPEISSDVMEAAKSEAVVAGE